MHDFFAACVGERFKLPARAMFRPAHTAPMRHPKTAELKPSQSVPRKLRTIVSDENLAGEKLKVKPEEPIDTQDLGGTKTLRMLDDMASSRLVPSQ